jgi:hypothetical protein
MLEALSREPAGFYGYHDETPSNIRALTLPVLRPSVPSMHNKCKAPELPRLRISSFMMRRLGPQLVWEARLQLLRSTSAERDE